MKLSDGLRRVVKAVTPWRPQPLQPARTVPQLYAIAVKVYASDIDDAEWSARIKDVVAKEGAAPALPHEISAAMSALTRKLQRPLPIACRPQPIAQPQPRMPPLTRDEARTILADLEARLSRRRA